MKTLQKRRKKATKAFYPEFLDEDGFGLLDALQRERMDEEAEESREKPKAGTLSRRPNKPELSLRFCALPCPRSSERNRSEDGVSEQVLPNFKSHPRNHS